MNGLLLTTEKQQKHPFVPHSKLATSNIGSLLLILSNQHQFDVWICWFVCLLILYLTTRQNLGGANEDGMHLGCPVPIHSQFTPAYHSIPHHTILPIPSINIIQCLPISYFSLPYLPYHTSHALDPISTTLTWAATLVNIKSGAVTRSLTLNLLIWLLDHQKQFHVFLNSQNVSDRPPSGRV